MRACSTLRRLAAAATVLLALPAAGDARAPDDAFREKIYAELDAVRADRKRELVDYLERIETLAEAVPQDAVMRRYFLVKREYHQLLRRERPPAEATAAIEQLKASLRTYYFENYHAFYDILFVDETGFVFSTIRQQADYHRDLFAGDLGQTALVRRLRDRPGEAFVDYEYYAVSDEPSAFFVQPMQEDGELRGWFVLQCSINRINSIFARSEGLGRTGEAFLVNRQHQMLTDSRFRAEHSILRQHLSRENIDSKFAEGRSHRIVVDYRGQRALTSFEVFPVKGTEWLLIAKIDEDEVLTRRFREDRARLEGPLLDLAAGAAPAAQAPPPADRRPMVVDLDEFRRGDAGRSLVTYGVNTCTAVVLSLPGRFSYLGHASVYDRMYGSGDLDLLGNLLARVRNFEIRPSEQREVGIVVVAPHRDSIAGVVARLLDEGYFLSQIRFVQDPAARSATVVHDPADGATWVGWRTEGAAGAETWFAADAAPSLGELLRRL